MKNKMKTNISKDLGTCLLVSRLIKSFGCADYEMYITRDADTGEVYLNWKAK